MIGWAFLQNCIAITAEETSHIWRSAYKNDISIRHWVLRVWEKPKDSLEGMKENLIFGTHHIKLCYDSNTLK